MEGKESIPESQVWFTFLHCRAVVLETRHSPGRNKPETKTHGVYKTLCMWLLSTQQSETCDTLPFGSAHQDPDSARELTVFPGTSCLSAQCSL